MSSIHDNLNAIKEQINKAAQVAGRKPTDIQLLAVSKTFPAEDIRDAYAWGQRAFGENYVQEGVHKVHVLEDLRANIEWHFIGPIQSNKSRDVAENFDWVHSIDRLKIAQRLNDQRPDHLPPINVCVQINISGEASKSGVQESELLDLCLAITALPKLKLRGLMSIPEPTENKEEQKKAHRALFLMFEHLKQEPAIQLSSAQLDTLSMGMSSDIESAIAEGSTMLRIGTAIFGKRTYL